MVVAIALLAFLWKTRDRGPAMDEAMAAGKKPSDFPHATNDFFRDMDGGVPTDARRGQGPQHVDRLDGRQRGVLGLARLQQLRHLRPGEDAVVLSLLRRAAGATGRAPEEGPLPGGAAAGLPLFQRRSRFKTLGVMNEPGFSQAAAPDEFGLCLDKNERTSPDFDEKVYGRASGVLGLRLYPNPNFDENARRRWEQNKHRYYTDPTYYSDLSARPPVPRRDGMFVLPRQPSPAVSAGRSREPGVPEPLRHDRRAVLLVRADLRVER